MKATCPNNCPNPRFHTTAHVQEQWEVDETGEYIKTIGCLDITHEPNPDNRWTCAHCGAEARVEATQPKTTRWIFQIEFRKRGNSFWIRSFKRPESKSDVLWPIRDTLRPYSLGYGFAHKKTGENNLKVMREFQPDFEFRLVKRTESFQIIDEEE